MTSASFLPILVLHMYDDSTSDLP